MSETPSREPELSELYSLVLSSQAVTRARFNVILRTLARIVARLEERDEEAVAEELRAQYEEERAAQSEDLKDYLMRPRSR